MRGVMDGLQDHPGLRDQRIIGDTDRPDPVHVAQANEHRAAVGFRYARAAQAGIAPLRHQRDAVSGGDPNNRCHFVRGRWRQHQSRRPALPSAPINQVWGDTRRVIRPPARPDCPLHLFDSVHLASIG